jgi:two-component system, response regulator YesN
VKKLLLVDDEPAFVESLALIIKRELSGEFEVAGTASTGREAIEKAAILSPDIVIMDLRMPGISGLDAIKEMRGRGASPLFILITAYERFDTVLEAVTLGVADYLLKPVSKDKLFLSLRSAALSIDRRNELERKIIEQREREEDLRVLVEASFLQAIMLGERSRPRIAAYLSALGLGEGRALVGAAAFLPPAAAIDSGTDSNSAYEAFCRTVRYKSKAIVGPFVAGHCAVFLPLSDTDEAEAAQSSILAALEAAHGAEIQRGHIKLRFTPPVRVVEAASAWAQALRSLAGARETAPYFSEDPVYAAELEEDEAFLEAVEDLSVERTSLALERCLLPIDSMPIVPDPERYRLLSILAAAYRILARLAALRPAEAASLMELGDIAHAPTGPELLLAARARLAEIVTAISRGPRRSDPVQDALAYIAANYGKQITLELVADALALSPNRLARLLFAKAEKGFSEILIDYRIERAKKLLAEPGAVIKQVSLACGYPDQNYFARLFKKKTGLTPTVFAIEATRDK